MKNISKIIKTAPFVEDVVKTFGYKFQKTIHNLADELNTVSWLTAMRYFAQLEKGGILTIERPSRKQGNTYIFNREKVKELIEAYNTINKIIASYKNDEWEMYHEQTKSKENQEG